MFLNEYDFLKEMFDYYNFDGGIVISQIGKKASCICLKLLFCAGIPVVSAIGNGYVIGFKVILCFSQFRPNSFDSFIIAAG